MSIRSDAIKYVKLLKEKFQHDSEVYDKLVEILEDFNHDRIDINEVRIKVKELLKGQKEVLLGFNTFLPKGYEIALDDNNKPLLTFGQALAFVDKVKKRFRDDRRVYQSFLDVMNAFRKNNTSIDELRHQMTILFRDHLDLLVEFTNIISRNG